MLKDIEESRKLWDKHQMLDLDVYDNTSSFDNGLLLRKSSPEIGEEGLVHSDVEKLNSNTLPGSNDINLPSSVNANIASPPNNIIQLNNESRVVD